MEISPSTLHPLEAQRGPAARALPAQNKRSIAVSKGMLP